MNNFIKNLSLISEQLNNHKIPVSSSLPSPEFVCEGKKFISFSSNNYLSLSNHPRMLEAAKKGIDLFGVANCESRLLGGDLQIYRDLEDTLAFEKGKESALLFATGFLTNLGALAGLSNATLIVKACGFKTIKVDRSVYFSDELNHMSIREGINLSGSKKITYNHIDMNDLENKLKSFDNVNRIIVSDGVFSMDGDMAPLPDLIYLAEKYDALLYIDDAHGAGLLGANGKGITEYFGVDSDRLIYMATLSKAYGALGGYIAASSPITNVLRYTSSPYGFTSAITPDLTMALMEAIQIVKDEPELRGQLWENQKYFVMLAEKNEIPLVSKCSCILPVFIGDETLCRHYADELLNEGFYVDAIEFPGVKSGESRLRINMNAKHTKSQIDQLIDIIVRVRNKNRLGEGLQKASLMRS